MFAVFAGRRGDRPVTPRERRVSLLLAVAVGAIGVVFWPSSPAHAAPCTPDEWKNVSNAEACAERLPDLPSDRAACVKAPTPSAPDNGVAGWFVTRQPTRIGVNGMYSLNGYAGYSFTTYDIGCNPVVMHPDYKFETTMANGEFMIANAIVGAANAFRERAWQPDTMWGWADPLVEKSTRAIFEKVFTVFGAITLVIVGLYLIWRSRQSDMSDALTTAGWAILVLVIVTAVASWPVWSAHLADNTLIASLNVVHGAVGPEAKDIPPDKCPFPNPEACKDHRPPAVRASDTATETILYRNWLRGTLGSADSETAQRYGRALYRARSFSWEEIEEIRKTPSRRLAIIERKNQQWTKVAEHIKREDPEAYEYLQGINGMERIGAGFIALLSAVFFALFDIATSILILLGFLIFRWAVIAAPIIGTIAIFRPAGGGLARLGNAVAASIFNILIFGTGAAIYLFAVDLIMTTPTLAGWLQVLLILLCGVVGWLLLRPYRRLTQLGGKDPYSALGSWRKRLSRDTRDVGATAAGTYIGSRKALEDRDRQAEPSDRRRPESETEFPVEVPPQRPGGPPGPRRPSRPGAPRPSSDRYGAEEYAEPAYAGAGPGQRRVRIQEDHGDVLYAEREFVNGHEVYVVHRTEPEYEEWHEDVTAERVHAAADRIGVAAEEMTRAARSMDDTQRRMTDPTNRG